MVRDLKEAAALLKYILTLDLTQCEITVCIASGDPDAGEYEFRRINQSANLERRFREAIDEALKDYRKGLDTRDIELREFVAETVKPEQEIEYLNILPYDSLKNQIRPLEEPLAMPRFRHDEQAFVKNMRFYVIRVKPRKGQPIYFYRHYSHAQMLSESPYFLMLLKLQQDLYDDLEEPAFLFDRHIDCIGLEEHMYLLKKGNFFKIFNIHELEKVARETLDKLEKKDIIHNFQRFKRDCLGDKIKILKLKNIAASGSLDRLNIDELYRTIQRYDLPIQVDRMKDGRRKMVYDPRERWAILHVLDDSYHDSFLTGNSYFSKGKRQITRK
jgi:hypothetical protein